MKQFRNIYGLLLLVLMMAIVSSCSVVAGIFKAGVWTGIIIVVLVIVLIIYLVTRGSKK